MQLSGLMPLGIPSQVALRLQLGATIVMQNDSQKGGEAFQDIRLKMGLIEVARFVCTRIGVR